MFVKKEEKKRKKRDTASCHHGVVTLEKKGTWITGISVCIHVCACILGCENSVLATTLSHITEPREVCGSSGLSDKIELTTKEG